jgi:sarcosine oxidase
VTLVEQYTPGHVRAASGGENRLIRFSHGADDWYTRSARRALELWRELESEAGAEVFVPSGVIWFFRDSLDWADESEGALRAAGAAVERLSPGDAREFFPSFDPTGVTSVLYEPEAGVLRARDATRYLAEQAVARGARFMHGTAVPADGGVELSDGRIDAEQVVWACGAWLARLFPELVRLTVTRQEVFFFGSPPEWQAPAVPAWVDFDAGVYGTGDVDGRGFKASPDRHGPEFDPDRDDRVVSPEKEREAREYVGRRFPALASAPLVGSRACPNALTNDQQFLVAPHPEDDHVWLLGGGSGHGFKHGPALAEYVHRLLDGEKPDPRFGLGPRDMRAGLRTATRPPSAS